MTTGADATATFAIDLESNAPNVAGDAASALESLRDEIKAGADEIRNMQSALRLLKGSNAVAGDSVKQLRDKISAQRAVVAQQQLQYVQLGGTFRNVARGARAAATDVGAPSAATTKALGAATGAAKTNAKATADLLSVLKGAPGPLSSIVSQLSGMSSSSLLAAGSTLALVGAMGALVAAVGVAVGALVRYGVAAADAERSEGLLLEGLSKHRNYWLAAAGIHQAADSAVQLRANIDQVGESAALSRDKIIGLQDGLYKAGLRGGNLQHALEGMAIVAAVQGDAAAEAWKGWALGAAITGQSVKALSDDVKARLGGIAARQMLSLGVQAMRLRENMRQIFRDVKVDGFLKGLNAVMGLFSQTTSSGKALKQLVEVILNPLGDSAQTVGPIVKDMIRGMILGAQELVIAYLDVRLWMKKTFGDSEILGGIKATTIALWAGKAAVYAVAGGAALVAGALTAASAASLALVAAFIAGKDAVLYLWGAIKGVNWDALRSKWAAVATAIIDGLVGGITSGAGRVVAAITDLGKRSHAAFKDSIQSRSPSKLFFRAGMTAPEGVAHAFTAGRPMVAREVARLVSVPQDAFARVASVARGLRPAAAVARPAIRDDVMRSPQVPAGRIPAPTYAPAPQRPPQSDAAPVQRGPLVAIEQLHVHAQSNEPQQLALSVRRELERILEGMAIHIAAESD